MIVFMNGLNNLKRNKIVYYIIQKQQKTYKMYIIMYIINNTYNQNTNNN